MNLLAGQSLSSSFSERMSCLLKYTKAAVQGLISQSCCEVEDKIQCPGLLLLQQHNKRFSLDIWSLRLQSGLQLKSWWLGSMRLHCFICQWSHLTAGFPAWKPSVLIIMHPCGLGHMQLPCTARLETRTKESLELASGRSVV